MSQPTASAKRAAPTSQPAASPEAAEAEPKGLPNSDRYQAETAHRAPQDPHTPQQSGPAESD